MFVVAEGGGCVVVEEWPEHWLEVAPSDVVVGDVDSFEGLSGA